MGNHETIPPMTREAWLVQFADWLETPVLRAQRLKDDPSDHKLRAYYHWMERNIDFISLDNATPDQFDPEQMNWLHAVLARDEASPADSKHRGGDARSVARQPEPHAQHERVSAGRQKRP